jgi:hypothetical protein
MVRLARGDKKFLPHLEGSVLGKLVGFAKGVDREF